MDEAFLKHLICCISVGSIDLEMLSKSTIVQWQMWSQGRTIEIQSLLVWASLIEDFHAEMDAVALFKPEAQLTIAATSRQLVCGCDYCCR